MLALVFAVVDLVAVFFSPSVSALVDFAAVVFAGFFAPSVAAFALVAFLLLSSAADFAAVFAVAVFLAVDVFSPVAFCELTLARVLAPGRCPDVALSSSLSISSCLRALSLP